MRAMGALALGGLLLLTAVALALPDPAGEEGAVSGVDPVTSTSGPSGEGEDRPPYAVDLRHDYTLDHERKVTFEVPDGVEEAWLTLRFQPREDAPGCIGRSPTIEVTSPGGLVHAVEAAEISITLGNPTCDTMVQERVKPEPGTWTARFEGVGAMVGQLTLEEPT